MTRYRDNGGAPMIRISLPWVVEFVRSMDALSAITVNSTYGAVWGIAYNATNQLDTFFNQSLYGEYVLTSRQSGVVLRTALAEILNGKQTDTINQYVVWNVSQARDQFRLVFLAELATLPSYFVVKKPPYDTNSLLNAGENLMPSELGQKVPEALFDAREAGKALAFELGTACGFHIFRALECVVRKYLVAICGSEAEPKNRNLGVYIKALEKGGANQKVVTALSHLKDLHRNPLVHPDAIIQLEDAIALAGMARSAVSAMLKEIPAAQQIPPPPIAESLLVSS